jgi:hypothetical protein
LPVQVEQLYHNINTWRTSCTIMRERYAQACDELGMSDALAQIEAECERLAKKAVDLYQRVVAMECFAGDLSGKKTVQQPSP